MIVSAPSSPNSPIEQTNDESEPHEEVEPASNAQIREMDSIVSAMEADVTTGCDFFTRANGTYCIFLLHAQINHQIRVIRVSFRNYVLLEVFTHTQRTRC